MAAPRASRPSLVEAGDLRQVAYAPDDETADRALHAKAAMFAALGLRVHLCGAANTASAARS